MASLNEAIDAVLPATADRDGFHKTATPGLTLAVASAPSEPAHVVYSPSLCIVAQGAKAVYLGDDRYDYGVGQYLIVAVEMPLLGVVTQATPSAPYLGLMLNLDIALMCEIMEHLPPATQREPAGRPGAFVGTMQAELAEAVCRLVAIQRDPTAARVLAPAMMREISYRLLMGSHGADVRRLTLASGATQRVARAIAAVRSDIRRTFSTSDLAAIAHMSASSLYHHFSELTAMTPLQYQKSLRLVEARRLMIAEDAHAAEAAHRVGYQSASQFSRDYVRMFGVPPRRDAVATRLAG